jgi:hypothetical protein
LLCFTSRLELTSSASPFSPLLIAKSNAAMTMDADSSVLLSFRDSHAWAVSEFLVDLYEDPNDESPKSVNLTQWMIHRQQKLRQ